MAEICYSDEYPPNLEHRFTLQVFNGSVANSRFGVLTDSELDGLEIDVIVNYIDTDVPDLVKLKYWDKNSIKKVYRAFGVLEAIELIERDVHIAFYRGIAWGISPV